MVNKRMASKQVGGGKRMKELGYKPIQLWVDREEMATLKEAAAKDGRPLTRFLLRAGLLSAHNLLGHDYRP
jgi:uncharacterized protein (DUF1778 family)